MILMMHSAGALVMLILCAFFIPRLTQTRWTWRSPRTGIVIWQALGLATGLSAIGVLLGFGLGQYHTGVGRGLTRLAGDLVSGTPPGWLSPLHGVAIVAGLLLTLYLAAAVLICAADVLRARRRHRMLLGLVAHRDGDAPGAMVLDHAAAAAYCVPGWHPTLVLSSGAVRMLARDQLAAVLAHERAHGKERHDLVLLPFAALRRTLPRSHLIRQAVAAVSLLVEMCADDRAARQHSPRLLANALRRFQTTTGMGTPHGALGVADSQIAARIERLTYPERRLPLIWRCSAVVAAAAAVIIAASFVVVPF